MRSRHAAFVERDARYLLRTLHLDHPSKARGENVFMASIEKRSAELTQ